MLPSPLNSSDVQRSERIQSLWSGYGEIRRVWLPERTLIVKHVHPPAKKSDASHARKCRSYDVETHFYRHYSGRCSDDCRVPALVASEVRSGEWLLALEDLDALGFSARRHRLSRNETEQCLSWLAAFHATFMGTRPDGLWKVGTYWHLATRPDELRAMKNAELRAAAPELDRRLSSAKFQTLVHGDAKPANFCFGKYAVAAVDFQYVGGGCGMKDVAYLLDEERYLDLYFAELRARLSPDLDADALEREWRELFPIARLDYERFLDGWRRI
ncbi:MAG: phosphotransferase [Labilithrix sp.]